MLCFSSSHSGRACNCCVFPNSFPGRNWKCCVFHCFSIPFPGRDWKKRCFSNSLSRVWLKMLCFSCSFSLACTKCCVSQFPFPFPVPFQFPSSSLPSSLPSSLRGFPTFFQGKCVATFFKETTKMCSLLKKKICNALYLEKHGESAKGTGRELGKGNGTGKHSTSYTLKKRNWKNTAFSITPGKGNWKTPHFQSRPGKGMEKQWKTQHFQLRPGKGTAKTQHFQSRPRKGVGKTQELQSCLRKGVGKAQQLQSRLRKGNGRRPELNQQSARKENISRNRKTNYKLGKITLHILCAPADHRSPYRRWTNYSNPCNPITPRTPNYNVVFFGLVRSFEWKQKNKP